jgi:hypothetical protein
MKYVALIALGALTLALGACAKEETHSSTTHSTATTGYHK